MTTRPPLARPVLNLFYILDTSGSMAFPDGRPITMLNRAMRTTTLAVRQLAEENGNAQIKVSVMEFSSMPRWLNPEGPEDLDAFVYEDLAAAGSTNMGLALKELNSKLSRRGFINAVAGNLMPVIIFMTDGYATDPEVFERELMKIRQNRWFREAARIGFCIGRNPDIEMIAKLTGNSESVIRTEDLGVFAQLLQWVSITSTLFQSTNSVLPDSGMWGEYADGRSARSVSADYVRISKEKLGYGQDDFGIHDIEVDEDPSVTPTWGGPDNADPIYVNSEDSGEYGTNPW